MNVPASLRSDQMAVMTWTGWPLRNGLDGRNDLDQVAGITGMRTALGSIGIRYASVRIAPPNKALQLTANSSFQLRFGRLLASTWVPQPPLVACATQLSARSVMASSPHLPFKTSHPIL